MCTQVEGNGAAGDGESGKDRAENGVIGARKDTLGEVIRAFIMTKADLDGGDFCNVCFRGVKERNHGISVREEGKIGGNESNG